MKVKSLQQAVIRLQEAKEERHALNMEIKNLGNMVADLSGDAPRVDLRQRNRNIYLEYEAGKRMNIKKHWLQIAAKYDLGPDQIRAIYNQQKALTEMKKG